MYAHAVRLFPEDFKFATPIEQLPQMWSGKNFLKCIILVPCFPSLVEKK